jgi:hypothetical protein
MTKWPMRESPWQPNEESQLRQRNIYDYNGEYEFPTVQHWTASSTVRVMSALLPIANPKRT